MDYREKFKIGKDYLFTDAIGVCVYKLISIKKDRSHDEYKAESLHGDFHYRKGSVFYFYGSSPIERFSIRATKLVKAIHGL